MQYRQLGSSDLKVSVIGLGNMSWPWCLFGEQKPKKEVIDSDSIRNMVATALDSGINFFETAEGYGRGLGEELLGNALSELGRRNDAIIATKVGPLFNEEIIDGRFCNLSSKHIRQRCELSLRRLKTDCIDLYMAHWPDAATPIEDTCEMMERLRDEGKIRWFGVSNFDNPRLKPVLKYIPVVVNQLPYSLIDRRIDADQRPFCQENQIGIVAYSPLGKGMLTGKYNEANLPEDYRLQRPHFAKENLSRHLKLVGRIREIASDLGSNPTRVVLAWVLAQPGLTSTIPGSKTPEQIRDTAEAGSLQLSDEALQELTQASEAS
jgi:aryl-alcohol dehydrogenase-like predicted oxidoreductase